MKQEMTGWQWHQLDHLQIIFVSLCMRLQTDDPVSYTHLTLPTILRV